MGVNLEEKDTSQKNLKDGLCAQGPTKTQKLMRHLEFQKCTEKLHCLPMKYSLSGQDLFYFNFI